MAKLGGKILPAGGGAAVAPARLFCWRLAAAGGRAAAGVVTVQDQRLLPGVRGKALIVFAVLGGA